MEIIKFFKIFVFLLSNFYIYFHLIFFKKTEEWYISENEWQRVTTSDKTSDKEWQRVVQ